VPAKLGGDGGVPGGAVKPEQLEKALRIWQRQQKRDKQINEKRKANNRSSLCWTCLRATWGCLCRWPHERWPKMVTKFVGVDDLGNELKMVVECPGYWEEGELKE